MIDEKFPLRRIWNDYKSEMIFGLVLLAVLIPSTFLSRLIPEEFFDSFLNPDFQLTDLRQVLPLNRTYLSQLINAQYGCSFYQWVNDLRIKEAKRLMIEQPELKIQDVAERCGFSSRRMFTQVFTRETGTTPTEWFASQNNPKQVVY